MTNSGGSTTATRAVGRKGVAEARRILHEALAAAREHDTAA